MLPCLFLPPFPHHSLQFLMTFLQSNNYNILQIRQRRSLELLVKIMTWSQHNCQLKTLVNAPDFLVLAEVIKNYYSKTKLQIHQLHVIHQNKFILDSILYPKFLVFRRWYGGICNCKLVASVSVYVAGKKLQCRRVCACVLPTADLLTLINMIQ